MIQPFLLLWLSDVFQKNIILKYFPIFSLIVAAEMLGNSITYNLKMDVYFLFEGSFEKDWPTGRVLNWTLVLFLTLC